MSRKPRRQVENADYSAMVGRMVRAYGRRLADADPSDLPDALAIMGELDRAIGQAVVSMRGAGFSWADVAAYTGTSRQAAQQRWGRTVKADQAPLAKPHRYRIADAQERVVDSCAHRSTADLIVELRADENLHVVDMADFDPITWA
jgi:hypothetical protein